MTKKEIFEIEQANKDKIHLFREGTFWKAYEKSAFHFIKEVRPYKPQKKEVKIIDNELVSIGFPVSALDDIVESMALEITEEAEKAITLKAPKTFDDADFTQWKESITIVCQSNKSLRESNPAKDITITDRIRNFNIESKTPMECMMFVSQLKQIIADYGEL